MSDANTVSGGLGQVMVIMSLTVMNIALLSAQRALHFPTVDRQWVITAYTLAFGSLLLLGGRLADLIGRKATFLTGLALAMTLCTGRPPASSPAAQSSAASCSAQAAAAEAHAVAGTWRGDNGTGCNAASRSLALALATGIVTPSVTRAIAG